MAIDTQIRMGGRIGGHLASGLARQAARATTAPVRQRRFAGLAAPVTDVDPYAVSLLRDPYGWWRELHAGGPVHRSAKRDTWLISGLDELRAAARAHEALSSANGVMTLPARLPMLVSMDRPDHARLRKLLARDFTKAALDRLRPRIEREAAVHVGEMLATHPAEARRQLTGPLPIAIIADVLGVPDHDRGDFRRWSDDIVYGAAIHTARDAVAFTPRVVRSTTALLAYFDTLIQRRRHDPGDDILSRLVVNEQDGTLTNAELYWFAVLLLVAGNETTTSLLTGLLHAFARHPDQYERLRADPSLIDATIDEGLRWTSPIRAFFRHTVEPYAVGHVTIPAGERVMLLFAAANRDPRHFDDPDAFRIERDASGHVAFGLGIHFCLGAHLARLEARAVLEQLIEHVAAIRPAGEPRWLANPSLHGITHLPVELTPAT